MRCISYVLCLLCFTVGVVHPARLDAQAVPRHTTTDWQVKPSFKYDALCLLNVLSGDPFYLHYYQGEYDHFHPLFTPAEQAAFVELKHILKDEGHGIVSATLSLYYSAVDDETLPEMIRTAHDSSGMKAALQKTPYWSADGWKNYETARPPLEVALKALQRVGFAAYWEANAKPGIEKRIAEIKPDLPKYNIVPVIEGYLGFSLPSNTITVYLLTYSKPHGIRVTGLRFLTHVSYPFNIVLHNAIHESMHPPYDAHDAQVRQAIDLLGQDPLVIDKVQHHDPSFGYNTTDGYIEEDSVQALEQIVSEKFGVGRNPCEYWRQQDGGMHVLAVAIYAGFKQATFGSSEPYSKWFVHAVETGRLRGRDLSETVESVFSGEACHRP
ncbi:MAG TPA: hypothetical protein VEG30_07615 [Terriglobales bacterium]|nr:hypothetical protein [Terriglobales bacterium]